jgi:hypothetical protein
MRKIEKLRFNVFRYKIVHVGFIFFYSVYSILLHSRSFLVEIYAYFGCNVGRVGKNGTILKLLSALGQ